MFLTTSNCIRLPIANNMRLFKSYNGTSWVWIQKYLMITHLVVMKNIYLNHGSYKQCIMLNATSKSFIWAEFLLICIFQSLSTWSTNFIFNVAGTRKDDIPLWYRFMTDGCTFLNTYQPDMYETHKCAYMVCIYSRSIYLYFRTF